jgi:phosphopentomutase
MDCCAKTVSLDRLLAQDTVVAAEGIVEQQQQQPEAAVGTPEILSPEVKELREELQEAKEEQVQEIEKELEEAKEELKEQEESDGNSNSGDIISDVGEDTPSLATAPVIEGEQEAPKVVEIPSEADAKFEARVFEWGPGHEVVPNDA